MPKLPVISYKQILTVAKKSGFEIMRQKGSHIILRDRNMRRVVVPKHKNIKPGTLIAILKQIGLEKEEFQRLLKK